MNTNRKIYIVLFISMAALYCTFIFYAFPRFNATLRAITSTLPDRSVVSVLLHTFSKETHGVSIIMALITAGILTASLYWVNVFLKPSNQFFNDIHTLLNPDDHHDLEGISATIQSACNSAGIIDSVPMGILVVNNHGVIQQFNREAGLITELEPSDVLGRPMLHFFPHNLHHLTTEVIRSGKEYLGQRNIVKVGGFFKEVLFSVSPLRVGETTTGAVAVFQDVTPQRKMIEVQAAYTLAKELATQTDLDGTVQVIAESAAKMVNIEFTAVFLADEHGRLILRAAHGVPAIDIEKYNSAPLSLNSPEITGLYHNIVPLLHGDVRNKQNLSPLFITPGIKSFYSFPITLTDQLIGFINLYSCSQNKLSSDMIYLIQSLSGQLNTAITNFNELQRIRTLADVDGLTGLYNKRYFQEVIQKVITDATDVGKPFSLGMLDIDHFKRINDSYGHQFGDRILKVLAGLVSGWVREGDYLCRYGGEEFALIMPGTSQEQSLEIMERIRRGIESASFSGPDKHPLKITISGGIACFPEDASNLEDLILYSDTALYAAKKSGRNRVLGYHPDQKVFSSVG